MCSTVIFGANTQKYLAENYDHTLDHGLVGINLKGTRKANTPHLADQAVRWTVKYGSITFNQFSLELPVSGMNEAGLAIALMWHEEGDFGHDERYLRLSALQWIQYQLDNYQSIAEIVEGLQTVRPEQGPTPLHFTLLDARGDSLLVEFIGGEPVLYENADYPIMRIRPIALALQLPNRTRSASSKPIAIRWAGSAICISSLQISVVMPHPLPVLIY